jgi:excisionase family DNA binding protein
MSPKAIKKTYAYIPTKPKLRTGEPDLPSKQNVFTCGEAAYLLCVSRRTVANLIKRRLMTCFRVNRDRRITRDEIIRYMKSIGMPLDTCLQGSAALKRGLKPRDMR